MEGTRGVNFECRKLAIMVSLLLLSATIFLLRVGAQSQEGPKQFFVIQCNDGALNDECQNETLEIIATKVVENSDVQINIRNSYTLELNSAVSFTHINSLTISGQTGIAHITCGNNTTPQDAGIFVSDISGTVMLHNLTITGCGHVTNIVNHTKNYSSALTILNCKNIDIDTLSIINSHGLGLAILAREYEQEKISIMSSNFKGNKLPQENFTESILGGGGVYVELSQQLSSMEVVFDGCTFEDNTQQTKVFNHLFTNSFGEVQDGTGRGGGVDLYIRKGCKNVYVSFVSCRFIGNQAFVGGGLSTKIYSGTEDSPTSNITVSIKDTVFDKNGCGFTKEAGFGGGAYITFDSYLEASILSNSHYLLENITFTDNCAEVGGGLYYSSNKDSSTCNKGSSVLIDGCTFTGNKAHLGSAVQITPSIFKKLSTSGSISPTFRNCQFENNSVYTNSELSQNETKSPRIGTIYISLIDVRFEGYNRFENNWGTAIYTVNGIINFKNSSASFIDNTGYNGGGVALIGSSAMIVGPHNYEFIKNRALYYGGAIYVELFDSADFMISRSCFIRYAEEESEFFSGDWNASLNFTKNSARDSSTGHTIYATSLYPCQVIRNGTIDKRKYIFVDADKVFSERGIQFDENSDKQPHVATDGGLIHRENFTPLMIVPGEKHNHSLTVTNDLGHEVKASFRATLNENEAKVTLDSSISRFVGDSVQLSGLPDQNVNLYLQIVSPRQTYISLTVKLLQCPPGFKLNEKRTCACNVDAYDGLYKCNLDRFHSHIIPGYWAGNLTIPPNNTSIFVTSRCPFCNYTISLDMANGSDFEIGLPHTYSELNSFVCGDTRKGTVCGVCQEHYTVHFHSPRYQCKSVKVLGCNFGWLLYMISELLPATLLFVIILVLNISFTSGAVNGFILFSQLLYTLDIQASGIIKFPKHAERRIEDWTEGYQVLYGAFNLDFFNSESLSFCLWRRAHALDMIAVKYVTILYTLVLIAIVVFIMNKCGGRCCRKCCRINTVKSSVIHGMTSFLIICYAQCIKVSLSLLIPVSFNSDEDSSSLHHPHVWLNGELRYFGKEHLPYVFPALFCLLTVGLLPLVLLLFYPLLTKVATFLGYENSKVFGYISLILQINKLKPLLDSFQGCFKDDMRFFAGLHFLYRWVILIIYINITEYSSYYTAVISCLVFMLALHAICQPYIKRAHNVIDTILLCNLTFIASLTFYNYFRSYVQIRARQGAKVPPAVVQLILIYAPLFCMGIYIVVMLCRFVSADKCGYKNPLSSSNNTMTLKEFIRNISTQDDDTDSIDEELTHDQLMDDEDVQFISGYDYVSAKGNRDTY